MLRVLERERVLELVREQVEVPVLALALALALEQELVVRCGLLVVLVLKAVLCFPLRRLVGVIWGC